MLRRHPFDWAAIIAALLSLAGTVYMEMTHTDAIDHAKAADIEHRVTAIEQKQTDDTQKLDHVQTQVDKLVEWALGSSK